MDAGLDDELTAAVMLRRDGVVGPTAVSVAAAVVVAAADEDDVLMVVLTPTPLSLFVFATDVLLAEGFAPPLLPPAIVVFDSCAMRTCSRRLYLFLNFFEQ